MKKFIIENLKTLFYALVIAIFIRSLLIQPFYIPSSSMEPNLLVGDRFFAVKYIYGYSRHSLPFSPKITNKRFFEKLPERGDVIVFKTPADNRTDYIKRLIGLPGDTVQLVNGNLLINDKMVEKKEINDSYQISCGDEPIEVKAYEEILDNGKRYIAVYRKEGSMQNSNKFKVPQNHYFFMGDNRDCSQDSRFLSSVGYVNTLNLVGKASTIFFSTDSKKGDIFTFWKWNKSIRFSRFFNKIK